jgi:hypothetical protein
VAEPDCVSEPDWLRVSVSDAVKRVAVKDMVRVRVPVPKEGEVELDSVKEVDLVGLSLIVKVWVSEVEPVGSERDGVKDLDSVAETVRDSDSDSDIDTDLLSVPLRLDDSVKELVEVSVSEKVVESEKV